MALAIVQSATALVWLRACTTVGRSPVLQSRPHIENYGRIDIGDNLRLSSTPVQSHLVVGPRGRLVLGDHVSIASGAAVAAHAEIRIGHRTQIGAYVMIMDTDFHGRSTADGEISAGQPIVIGDDVRIGSGVTILKGTVIGDRARIRPGSVVSGLIAAGAQVGGVPARILSHASRRHAGVSQPAVHSVLERVQQVVATTFGLAEPPMPALGRDDIVGWDSLGTLKLVLALEDEFASTLNDTDIVGVADLYDLATAVQMSVGSTDTTFACG